MVLFKPFDWASLFSQYSGDWFLSLLSLISLSTPNLIPDLGCGDIEKNHWGAGHELLGFHAIYTNFFLAGLSQPLKCTVLNFQSLLTINISLFCATKDYLFSKLQGAFLSNGLLVMLSNLCCRWSKLNWKGWWSSSISLLCMLLLTESWTQTSSCESYFYFSLDCF